MQTSIEQLTPFHKDLLQVCLSAKVFKAPLQIMERDIFDVSADGVGACQFRDLLLYYYYGGMIYIGLKQFSKALDFLRLCFSAPTMVLNQIMIEAYKKYILVSLIEHGEVQGVHKYTSQTLIRHVKSCCQPYNAVCSAFESHSAEKLREAISTHEAEFKKDENFGLVLQVEASLVRHNIQRLKTTYLTLSLSAIAQNVGCADAKQAEQIVLKMVGQGDLLATINQQDGMVAFHDDDEQYNSSDTIAKLHEDTKTAMELNKKLQELEWSIAADPAYLSKMAMHERTARWGESDPVAEGASSLWAEAEDKPL
jgi:COP9 signalosome complex subunit 3